MTQGGASPSAIEFARRMGGDGVMKRFEKRGRIDVARVRFLLRPNAAETVVLVNGDPAVVDVSDPDFLAPLLEDRRLKTLRRDHPTLSLVPGVPGFPGVRTLPDGGQRFIFAMPLRDCATCEDLSTGFVAYDFEGGGHLIDTKLIGVRKPTVFSIGGEVTRGKAFEAKLAGDLVFRLEAIPEGWTIAVKDAAGHDFCGVVTPPFHGPNPLSIDAASLGTKELGIAVRRFRCVRSASDYELAAKALGRMLWGDGATPAEIAAAQRDHARLSAAARDGDLAISDTRLSAPANDRTQTIESLKFRFNLFRAPDESAAPSRRGG
jgi:hypothetical protein